MGCGCFSKHVDQVAPSHKPYVVPPGGSVSSTSLGSGQQHAAEDRGSSTQQRNAETRAPTASVSKSTPSSSSTSKRDFLLLAQGSQVQGLVIVPWVEEDADIASNFGFASSHQGAVFEDRDGLVQLSARQKESLQTWRRFPELVRLLKGDSDLQPQMLASTPASSMIRQGLVGDCSFLSALSVLAEYERRFGEPVLSSIIYPKDGRGKPVYNEYGQYACRLFLNGTTRKVVVDDRVPVRGDGRMLCAHSGTPHELWVTILEKSFAKIMGSSYDVQGSNPGTDVFHLTGWVPETIPLAGLSDRDMTGWHEIFRIAERGYHDGRCIICLGTSEIKDAVDNDHARQLGHLEGVSVSTGLVARHAYPVLDCRHIGDHRILRLKNPWGKIRWRGRFAPGDAGTWKEVAKASGGGNNFLVETFGYDPASNTADDGLFWIAWEDVLHHFSHLYLCWSPSALGHRMEVQHGSWNADPHFSKSSLPDDTHLVAFNPQFHLRLQEPLPDDDAGDMGGIWVLLSRHVQIRADLTSRYVAAHIYDGKARLCCPDAPKEMGIYSNGECALVRLSSSSSKGQTDFVLVVSQHAHKVAFNFTLQVYSSVPGTLTPIPPLVPDSHISGSAEGSWTTETAGGCSNDLWAYFKNPHWRLEIPAGGLEVLKLFLECPAEHSVNARLFVGEAARPESLRTAASSGAYRQGCCFLRLEDVPPGPHVLVVSTFRPGLLGEYRLAWHASQAIELRPQPHPFAAPLEPPLECLARLVTRGVRTRLRISQQLDAKAYEASYFYNQATSPLQARKTLLSARLQCDFKVGLPPLLRLFRDSPGSVSSNPQAGDSSPLQPAAHEEMKESFAESYFTASGAAVLLLAELLPGERLVLELQTAQKGNGSNALYINSDGPLDLEDLTLPSDGDGAKRREV